MIISTNSKYVFSFFHPEYLVDLLRAGGRFPVWQTFSLPSTNSTENEISEFIDKKFPPLSEERYEIWVKFRLSQDKLTSWFSLEDIESAHFYSRHRQEAGSGGVLHTLNVYGVTIGEPLDVFTERIIEVYGTIVREHAAISVVNAWFPEISISKEFIDQLKMGYIHQQSPSPEKLPPISSEKIWAHMVAYNPGLRKFDERPDVLWLQDIQEVIRRTDAHFKQKLKSIGDKYSSKFTDLLDDAERSKKLRIEPSKWLLQNVNKSNTYLFELDRFLSSLGEQQSFFYTSLLYLNWREKILDSDFTGRLADNKGIAYFLKNTSEKNLRQSVAEALFSIVYAGGPRVFQKALIEARMKILNIDQRPIAAPEIDLIAKEEGTKQANVKEGKTFRLFSEFKIKAGSLFNVLYKQSTKKKEIQSELKSIQLKLADLGKGIFDYKQYLKLCSLFGLPVEQFDDQPYESPTLQEIDNLKDKIYNVEIKEFDQSEKQKNIIEEADGIEVNAHINSALEQTSEIHIINLPADLTNEQSTALIKELNTADLKSHNYKLNKPVKTKRPKKEKTTIASPAQVITFPSNHVAKVQKDQSDEERKSH